LLTENKSVDLCVTVGNSKHVTTFQCDDIKEDEDSRVQLEAMKLGHIKSSVEALIKDGSRMQSEFKDKKGTDEFGIQLKGLVEKVEIEEEKLNEFIGSVTKGLKTSQRKDIYPMIQEIRDLAKEFYAVLKVMQYGQIDNDLIASLNALAYRNITKKGLQKKLDKRTQKNVNLINDVYGNISKIVAKYDIPDLEKKYEDLSEKIGACVLSCNNFVEALADEDCLCLTFDIRRTQAVIADPSQASIKTVYPSMLTAGSFLYSANFAIKKDAKAHGGFERNAEGLIVKGAASEHITGVMPLYISPEHWRVAKLLMKPTLGWSCTLDPLGYSYSQVKIIPFMVLAKLAEMINEKPDSNFLRFQFTLVKETCIQILKDGSQDHFEEKFSDELIKAWKNYPDDPAARTVDVIAHNPVFLAQIYIAMEAGYIDKGDNAFSIDKIFRRVIEEEMRRKQAHLEDGIDNNDYMFKMLNVDGARYID
jgi:hypothetical protein